MKVFKFGGASVKDAESVKNVVKIVDLFPQEKLLIVISAMGKTTNALEKVVEAAFKKSEKLEELIDITKSYHSSIINSLFSNPAHPVFEDVENLFHKLRGICLSYSGDEYDFFYDQIVGFGELISTCIIEHYMRQNGKKSQWEDVRQYIRTNDRYRDAAIDWTETQTNIANGLLPKFDVVDIVISQGFIGENEMGFTTTLGREGSDFTGAIFAYCLDAESLTIWKDVPGLLNADPKLLQNTVKLDTISYAETIELSYYGASIIHPKTIKPLENKKIPLFVKSFIFPDDAGSVIQESKNMDGLVPSIIFKKNQVLISIAARDFSFIAEQNLATIFSKLATYNIRVNLMQNSAISFSVCVDNNEERIAAFIVDLKKDFKIRYNEGLELITVRHYTDEVVNELTSQKSILLEQRSRVTVQMVVK